MTDRLTPDRLTMPQVESLIALGLFSPYTGASPGSIARARGLSRTMGSNVSQTLERLVAMGLAADAPSAGARPAPRYRITAAGLDLLTRVTPAQRGVFRGRDLPGVGTNIEEDPRG